MNTDLAYKVAEKLVENDACLIEFPKNPDEWVIRKNGIKTPLYLNCRNLLKNPKGVSFIVDALSQMIKQLGENFETIIGIETAGIPIAANVAFNLEKPFGYVRKEVKKYGIPVLVEGDPSPNASVLVFDDLVMTGSTLISSVEALKKEKGINVKYFATIVSMSGTDEINGVKIFSLTNYTILSEVLFQKGLITKEQVEKLSEFYKSPLTYKWD